MPKTDRLLDDEIAEVEARLARNHAQLRLLAAEARSRLSRSTTVPIAMAAALAAGFAAARFARRRPAPRSATPSRTGKVAGALTGMILPLVISRLQHVVMHWVAERIRERQAGGAHRGPRGVEAVRR